MAPAYRQGQCTHHVWEAFDEGLSRRVYLVLPPTQQPSENDGGYFNLATALGMKNASLEATR